MYKYSCRKCPIRNRCIDESSNADSIRVMIRRAFEAKTDTLATWGRLQTNCLLVKAEKDQKNKKSALKLRLEQAKATRDDISEPEYDTKEVNKNLSSDSQQIRVQRLSPSKNQQQPSPDYLQPVSSKPKPKRTTRPLRRISNIRPISGPEMYWLTVESSNHHITLPKDGTVVFGRFDPNVGIPPDIDLTFEDQGVHLVSRRHAGINATENKHIIEDLGSKMSVYLNGTKLNYGPSRLLEHGDTIRLGHVSLHYNRIPASVLQRAKTSKVKHFLRVTPTGRIIPINPSNRLIFGRRDERVKFVPDIDLSEDGDISKLVSRRHAMIQWQNGQPHIEDLGSGFGTRLRGQLLSLGQETPLFPGDHIWLAGCVLAYDIET